MTKDEAITRANELHPLEIARLAEEVAFLPSITATNPSETTPEAWITQNGKEYPRFDSIELPTGEQNPIPITMAETLAQRRSVRQFSQQAIPLTTCSAILECVLRARDDGEGPGGWSKPFPSAGARWPIEAYLASERIEGIPRGLYYYDCFTHNLVDCRNVEAANQLVLATVDSNELVEPPPMTVILTGVFPRTWSKYGARGSRFVHMEAGAVAMALSLTAKSVGLDGYWIGGFVDRDVGNVLDVSWEQELEAPLLIMPFGYPIQPNS